MSLNAPALCVLCACSAFFAFKKNLNMPAFEPALKKNRQPKPSKLLNQLATNQQRTNQQINSKLKDSDKN
jgi:hypothetical protein